MRIYSAWWNEEEATFLFSNHTSAVAQWFPIFLAPGTDFQEDQG